MNKFSVCMSVYRNDKPDDFYLAVSSIYKQTVTPGEIILVVDGPVTPELEGTIEKLNDDIPILRIIRLEKNSGHAVARQTGLNAVTYDLVAIMDSDDISLPDRFEKQIRVFEQNPDISVVGGVINEFIESADNIVGIRSLPQYDEEIKNYLKSRCPMNLVTVMAKKDDIQAVGGYIDWYCEEDYYLWIRLAQNGYKFHNLQDNLVNVRVGKDMYKRRGGWKYFKSEAALQKYMLNHNIISLPRFMYNVGGRFAVQVMMPNKLRGFIFQKFFRASK